mmetsp:Transcript_10796/g.23906  ORF Transcript_10796/g.23906 Transcript_10796/m.23906 type:complete len:152 (-) Transcript_10796:179-634(-)
MTAGAHSILKALLLWHLIAIVNCMHSIPVAFVGRSCCSTSGNKCDRSHYTIKNTLRPAMAVDPNNTEDDGNDEDNSLDEKMNSFLDTPFFDPDDPSNDNNWFANLIKNDYYNAETLYVGVIMFFGVIVAQELLRIVKYGGGFVPSGGGKLF